MTRALLGVALAVLMALLPIDDSGAEVGDIAFTRKSGGGEEYPPAMFPHWLHRIQFKCHVCHDSIVVMKAGANPITMDAIDEGKYCGACHNGKTAFGMMFEACPRCHRP